ncbi:MAG: hypothetical protein ACYDIE_13480 [Candidatus Krumholzibacteriia bacterium]
MRGGTRILPMAGMILLLLLPGCGGDDSDPGLPDPAPGSAVIADHEAVALFGAVQSATCDSLRARCRIYYGHTSHGSQVVTGLQMLAGESAVYAPPTITEVNDDLGVAGDVTWVAPTRAWLDAHPGACELVVWSWCGGVSDNTVEGIDIYLGAMAALEADYPGVVFVYMTGHLDGTGDAGNLKARNDQIRAWCRDRGKVLFDFADIEAHDPAGAYHPDETDACAWCADWCATHDCPDCAYCAHSHCFNCYRKGQAFWVLLARLAAAGRL